jgi:hypothetical protein
MHEVKPTDRIGDAPAGTCPIGIGHFSTHNIRLSAALCCFGFNPKMDQQPIAVTIDADNDRRIVTFMHDDASESPLIRFSARDVDLWWNAPKGKYTIEGYDDALTAIHRVFQEREALIGIARNPNRHAISTITGKVETASIHTASILAACEIGLTRYEPNTRRWIFGKGAEVIADLITKGGQPKDQRPLSNDLCIDWMLMALKYHDWLKQIVKDPDNIPMIEMRDGERVLQISSGMDEREQRKWISYL